MSKTDELAAKVMHKLERRNLVQPGTVRVVIDVDLAHGLRTHAITKNSGHKAKELIDGIYAQLADLADKAPAPATAARPADKAPAPARASTNGSKSATKALKG